MKRMTLIMLIGVTLLFSGCANLQTANELIKNQKFKDAEKFLIDYTKNNPSNSDGFNKLGWTYYYIGKYNDSIESFKKANKINDNNNNYNGLALSFIKLKKFDKALRNAKKYKELITRTNTWRSFNLLGYIYLHMHDYENSIINFNKALDLKKNSYSYLGLSDTYMVKNNLIKSVEFAKKALTYLRSDNYYSEHHSNIHNRIANNYYIAGKYDLANYSYKKAFKYYPNLNSYTGLALNNIRLGKYIEAKKNFEDILNSQFNYQQNFTYYNILGWYYYYTGELDKAITSFKESNELKEIPHNYYGLWKCYKQKNIIDKKEFYKKLTIKTFNNFIEKNKYIHKTFLLDMKELKY